MTVQPSPPRADRAGAAAFRDLLRRAGYTRDGIQAVLGVAGDVLARPQDRPVYLRRLEALRGGGPAVPDALATFLRLFLLDAPVDPDVAEQALGAESVRVLDGLGVVGQSAGSLRGVVRIVPHGDIVVASDLPDVDGEHPDHVAGLHRPSNTLADLTIRRRVRTALDVGTGNGIQALLAARHTEHVVATDINERALAFAALNAALNGVANIEFRAGSFFEPVASQTFDLVVCNPPYVISPETAYLFRDSGLGRDRVIERLVGELPQHLAEGAFGTIMVSWIQAGDDIAARPREWLAGTGCDAWILHTGSEDPLTAAATWNRDLATKETEYAAAIDRWVTYFREEEIDALSYGGIILRRRGTGGPNWVRNHELPNGARQDPEAHLLRLFTGPDLSNAMATDDALAGQRLSLAPGATITTHLRRVEGGWEEASDLTLERGVPFSAELDRFTVDLVAQLDGSRPLGDVLDAFATQHEAPAARVRASGLGLARTMLELGFAASAGPDSASPAS